MNITAIITATVVVGAVGIFVGLFLGIAGIQFKVQIDEREEAVQSVLPGNNCGGCGYAGCSGLASAIAKEEAVEYIPLERIVLENQKKIPQDHKKPQK